MTTRKYADSPTRSAEILRVALPQMTRQAAGANPISYAVWYEHVSGRNQPLSESLSRLIAGEAVLDDETTARLYMDHVADIDEQAAHKVAEGFRKLLSDMSDSAQAAGAQTDRFGDSLSRFSQSVEQGQAPDAVALREVIGHTQDMRAAVGQLQGRLSQSQQEIERLRSEVDRARNEALMDALTGLPNRRAFDQRISAALADAAVGACLVVTDIDHFKKVNDTYGHLFGDSVLRVVAQALRACIVAPQVAARVGGEEFAVLLPGATLPNALQVAEKIRTTIAGSRIRRKDSQESIGQVTVSLGVAQRRDGETAEAWFERADKALYTSKQSGRNRVTLAEH